jgi:type VI protein secretion system component VasK
MKDERAWGIVLILGFTAAVVIVVTVVISQIFSLARIKASGEVAAERGATREDRQRVAAELGGLRTRVSMMEKQLHQAT